jgi:hypothetical protein
MTERDYNEDLQKNTVLSEIKNLSAKHLIKFKNHTDAVAMNLLGNRETALRLKR